MPVAMPTHVHPWSPMPTHALRGLTGTHRIARGAAPTDGFACGLLQVLRSSPHAEGLGTPTVLACGQEAWCANPPEARPRRPVARGSRVRATWCRQWCSHHLAAGLFLARRRLVRNSPSPPRPRCATRPRASVRACSCASCSPAAPRIARTTCIAAWPSLPVEVAGSLPWTVLLGTGPSQPLRAAWRCPPVHGSVSGRLWRGVGWLELASVGFGWLRLGWVGLRLEVLAPSPPSLS